MDIAPLTIILGRNNSGKSTLIQSLLLLKQTLNDPRLDVMLRLEGIVDAFSLRELTYGWPAPATKETDAVEGPTITLQLESEVNVLSALNQARSPDLDNLAKHSKISWLKTPPDRKLLRTSIKLFTQEIAEVTQIAKIELRTEESKAVPALLIERTTDGWRCAWYGKTADLIDVELSHFIPYLRIDRTQVGPRDGQRAWYNAYLVLFAQPLEDLKRLLSEFHYLGSSRLPPPSLFKTATTAPNEIGVSGELAAQLLHRRKHEIVHFLPPVQIENNIVKVSETVRALPLVDAVNMVMKSLAINAPVRVEEIQKVGFRLMLGDASLPHVGRGLNSLLPLVELGLFADPIRLTLNNVDLPIEEYGKMCDDYSHIALEEPEAHLHPKIASRLAHWLVSLAQTNRRLIVETHSDHLVRRLRGLAVRAGAGSKLEQWLLNNVSVVSVEQDSHGCSHISTSRLTPEGDVKESWPADFMDEATDEESAIYYAKLDKDTANNAGETQIKFRSGKEPDTDDAP